MFYEILTNLWLCESNSVSPIPDLLCLSNGLPVHAVKVHGGVDV